MPPPTQMPNPILRVPSVSPLKITMATMTTAPKKPPTTSRPVVQVPARRALHQRQVFARLNDQAGVYATHHAAHQQGTAADQPSSVARHADREKSTHLLRAGHTDGNAMLVP